VIVVAQTPEVVEGYHLQVRPGESIRELLANGFEDTHSRLLLNPLGKCLLLALGLLLRRRLVAGNAVMNVAFFGLAEIEDAASALAVNENGDFGVGAPFAFAFRYCPSKSMSLAWPFACHAGVMLLGVGALAAVFLEFVMKRFQADAQQLRGARFVVTGGAQGLQDQFALHRIHRRAYRKLDGR
jgi:hypothetical protein